MNTAAYFKARAEAVKRRGMAQADQVTAQAVRAYQKADEAIAAEVRKIYERYGTDYGLTYAEAQKALSGSAYKEWRMTLAEYVERINQTGDKALQAELDALSARSRISRYEQLRTAISVETAALSQQQEARVGRLLSGLYEESYYHTAFDLQKGTGLSMSLSLLPSEQIAQAVAYPWSGADFSERIWANSRNLAEDLRQTLTQGLIQGQDLRQMTKALQEKTQAAARDCERLIQTESARVMEDAELLSYRRCGVTQYEILGTLDRRTCPVCGKQDGKVYAVDDAQTGKNYPPFHPRCRCTTVAVFDDEEAGEAENSFRAGRDEEGNYTLFPADTTYEEWKEGLKRDTKTDIVVSNKVSGAINPLGKRASEHAERYYELVRHMKTDVAKIAKTTGYSEEKIQAIKQFVFMEEHDLGDRVARFDPDFMMAESWQRLIEGKPEKHDLTLIHHEIMEKDLMEKGYSQDEAHRRTTEFYNYGEEARAFYAKIGKFAKER